MLYRIAEQKDLQPILTLYQKVAKTEGGIARLPHEVTHEYVHNFLTKSISSGLIIVGEDPGNAEAIIAEIHAYKSGLKVFNHIFTDLTLVVHPAHQGKKIGRTIFTIFLEEIARNRTDIGRVELITRESNVKAIQLYQSLGFRIEGRMEMRIKTTGNTYEADIPMSLQNPNYEF
jgi:ribosomal protein S18 acetylase RimI-like enzyme